MGLGREDEDEDFIIMGLGRYIGTDYGCAYGIATRKSK
jgi:hypothetical protein